MTRRRHQRGDRAAVLVEAALGIPILLIFVLGFIDIGMWTLNGTQATTAAKDGARAGILVFESADIEGSSDWDTVVAAANSDIDHTIANSEIDVTCVDDGGNVVTCASADPDADFLRVEVTWSWNLTSFIGSLIGITEGNVTGRSTMRLIPAPADEGPVSSTTTSSTSTTSTSSTSSTTTTSTTSTTTPGCSVISHNLSQNPVVAKTNGRLADDLTVSFTTNGAGTCTGLSVRLTAPNSSDYTKACGCGSDPNHSFVYGRNTNSFWTAGVGTIEVLKDGSPIYNQNFVVIVA